MAEYKVGDRVRIVTEKTGTHWNSEGKMNKWLGKIMTVKKINSSDTVKMVEDEGENLRDGWYWKPHMIAGLAEPQPFLRETGKAVYGKKYKVLNHEDRDFPKGTVVTAMDDWGFSSDDQTEVYMNRAVLLQEITEESSEELTFIQLIEKLPELAVGTKVAVKYSNTRNTDTCKVNDSKSNKGLVWSDGENVQVNKVTSSATYKIIPTQPVVPPKPEYTEIKWQEAFQIVADGGTVYADDKKVAVNKVTDLEDEISCYDFDDLLEGTDWFKKTE